MTTSHFGFRFAGLLAGGAFALHQLRYLVGYGDGSHGQLASQGHGYMTLLGPLVAVGLMLLTADFCARLVRAHARRRAGRAPQLRELWAAASASLLATYVVQETLEGVLAPGHPGGVAGLLGHGGWSALPLAVALGLAIALLVRGSQRAIELAAEPPPRTLRPRAVLSVSLPARPRAGARRGVARLPGARGPPLVSTL